MTAQEDENLLQFADDFQTRSVRLLELPAGVSVEQLDGSALKPLDEGNGAFVCVVGVLVGLYFLCNQLLCC